MTTELLKRVERVTLLPHRGRKLVIALLPGDLLEIREKGRRTREVISIAGVFDYAIITRVAHERFEKKKKKDKFK
jgi:hypothetical protein